MGAFLERKGYLAVLGRPDEPVLGGERHARHHAALGEGAEGRGDAGRDDGPVQPEGPRRRRGRGKTRWRFAEAWET